jgi:hypothetical protein
MRKDNGPEYVGDGILNGVALTDAENNNQAGQVIDIQVCNAGAAAILLGDAVSLMTPLITPASVAPAQPRFGSLRNVKKFATADANFELIVGGALEAIPVGGVGRVRVRGVQEGVNVVTATAALVLLSGGAADGRLAIKSATHNAKTAAPAALSMSVAASNQATVYWMNPLQF